MFLLLFFIGLLYRESCILAIKILQIIERKYSKICYLKRIVCHSKLDKEISHLDYLFHLNH